MYFIGAMFTAGFIMTMHDEKSKWYIDLIAIILWPIYLGYVIGEKNKKKKEDKSEDA